MQMLVDIQKDLMQYALIKTQNRHNAEDLLGDTNFKILERGILPNYTYAMKVMRSILIDNWRKRKISLINYELPDVEDKPDCDNIEDIIQNSIDKLSGQEQRIMRMRFNGISNTEIAKFLGITRNTVGRYIYNARQKLTA